ncbi:MAG: GNAT family N-acetyltransferase [Microbacterium arborescens]
MTRIAVRRAVVADAAGIAHVHVRGWHEAYTGRMPQRVLDRLDIDRLTRARQEMLRQEESGDDRRGSTWVATSGGAIVGWAASGPSRDDPPVADLELFAIYVLAAHYGTGAGQALLDAAVSTGPASLWVLDDNPRARAFYARNGFAPDGASKDDVRWGDAISEVRLVRR